MSEPTTTAATGAAPIAAERKRQIESEGWSIEHGGTSFKPKGPTDTDTWSFATREKCEGYRDECAARIDALIAEVREVLDAD